MSQFFLSPIDKLRNIQIQTFHFHLPPTERSEYSSSQPLSEIGCKCIQPCNRVIYDPSMSNAALSELAIEDILAVENEAMMESVK